MKCPLTLMVTFWVVLKATLPFVLLLNKITETNKQHTNTEMVLKSFVLKSIVLKSTVIGKAFILEIPRNHLILWGDELTYLFLQCFNSPNFFLDWWPLKTQNYDGNSSVSFVPLADIEMCLYDLSSVTIRTN